VLLRSLIAAAAAFTLAAPALGWAQSDTAAPAAAPPAGAAPAAPAAPEMASPNLAPNGNMFTTLKSSGDFTILTKALDDAQLSKVLSSQPGLTLFAPTDAAFKALPPAQLNALMKPDNAPTLQKILIYHLVNLQLDSSKIKGSKGQVPSVETSKLQLDGSGSPLKVNNADIIQPDVRASNGIIQVIDKVLIPGDVTLPTASAQAAPSAANPG
jgi:uncharacterized surface protein with fasciclin (FAS1) repeats